MINATVFPRAVLAEAQFDERLRYGCDEIDMARHALALGCLIRYNDDLWVDHHPSAINRGVPLHSVAPRSRLTKDIEHLAGLLGERTGNSNKGGFFRNLLSRKADNGAAGTT